MKRIVLACVFMVCAAAASAQTVRMEIGDNGIYTAGEWTNCRVSGFDNVADGTLVTVNVSDMFLRDLRVRDGVAEGRIIIPDDAPDIRVEIKGVGSARVAPEDLARLTCVMDAEHSGSVRPDLYEIFGAPAWPWKARRNVAFGFAFVLVVAALASVSSVKTPISCAVSLLGVALIGFAAWAAVWFWLALQPSNENVSIFETDKDAATGVLTTALGRAHMWQADAGKRFLLWDAPPFVPVAAYRGEWNESPVRMDADDRAFRVPSRIPSRDVMMNRSVVRFGANPPIVLTDGQEVWIWKRMRGPEGSDGYVDERCLFVDYVNHRHHADPRIEALRDGTLRWWRKTRFEGGIYSIGWLDGLDDPDDARGLNAGTLVVTKGRPDITQNQMAPLLP